MGAQTEKTTFACKDDLANFTCILEWGQGTCKKSRPCPARAYTTLVVLFKKIIIHKQKRNQWVSTQLKSALVFICP